MEALVASHASRLLSDDYHILDNAYAVLAEAQAAVPPGKSTFPRLVQELAVYRQASIISKLLKQVLEEYCYPIKLELPKSADGTVSVTVFEDPKQAVSQWSYSLFIFLSGSPTVAHFCLRDKGVDQALLGRFLEHLPSPRSSRTPSHEVSFATVPLPSALSSLEGIVSYARASQRFRQLISNTDRLLPALQSLFEEETIQRIGDAIFPTIRQGVASLLLTLTLRRDSQEWMVEKGFLALLASICGTVRYDTEQNPASGTCTHVLRILCEDGILSKKHRQARELFVVLEPHSNLLDGQMPGVWHMFLETLGRKRRAVPADKTTRVKTVWRFVTAKFLGIPSVCSWEGCSALEADLGNVAPVERIESFKRLEKLSKCGRCAMAMYCSKEHQKLHWRTHKKDCFEEQRK